MTAAEIRPQDRFRFLGSVYEVRTVAQGSAVLFPAYAKDARLVSKHVCIRTLLAEAEYLGRAPRMEA